MGARLLALLLLLLRHWCQGQEGAVAVAAPQRREALWWLSHGPGPEGGPSNLEWVTKHRAAITRASVYCWHQASNGSLVASGPKAGASSRYPDPCAPEFMDPIIATGVEVLPAGTLSREAIISGAADELVQPLVTYCLERNFSGANVDLECKEACPAADCPIPDGHARGPGCVSEEQYVSVVDALGKAFRAHGLVLEICVGNTYPVHDEDTASMEPYFEAVHGSPTGALAMMSPTYHGDRDAISVQTIEQLTATPGHAAMLDVMFGVAFDAADEHRNHFPCHWNASNFARMLEWTASEGVCRVGIYTSPGGNGKANTSWTRFVAPWMVDSVAAFLAAPADANCTPPEPGPAPHLPRKTDDTAKDTAPPTAHRDAVFGVNITTGVVYAQGLYCNAPNFSQTNCSTVDLTLDVLRPVVNASNNAPLPTQPMAVMLGIHGGSYSHGDSSEEHANLAYFVQRGFIGFSINYRVCNQAPYTPPGVAQARAESGGNLVCSQFGSFPSRPPYGNESCSGVKTFGLGTDDGCPLSSPPKLAANATGKGRPGSFFGTLMAWVRPKRI